MINDIVVDFNVVFSAILGVGHSYKIFEINDKIKKFNFIAPQFMYVEIGIHSDEIIKKTKFSLEKAQETIKTIIEQITFISDEEFKNKTEEAKQILKGHEKDIPYLALALAKNCKILSGDKIFKELCPDTVETPREILNIFESLA